MRVQINRPVELGDKTYGIGQHEIPGEVAIGNWFFDALVGDGDAAIIQTSMLDVDAPPADNTADNTADNGKGAAGKGKKDKD